MNTPNAAEGQVTADQVKRASQLGYAAYMQHAAKVTAVEGVKAATDSADKLKGLVAKFGERMDKRAARRQAVFQAIVAPA